MAFDGIVVSGVVWELSGIIEGSRITKIYQAEKDEILLVCHKNGENYKLLISCSPANPRIHLQRRSKENPMVAPPFCMILRKHIQGGRINKIIQSGYDRVITLKIETYNEMGDTVVKNLIAEIMGRHSNIILTGPSGVIYDAIKHVDDRTSSIREILPARPYLPPPSQNKISPDDLESIGALISDAINTEAMRSTGAAKFLLSSISGFSPLLSKKVCRAANVDPETRLCSLTEAESSRLTDALLRVCRNIAEHSYKPFIFTEDCGSSGVKYCDFHCIETPDSGAGASFSSVNLMLDEFFSKRDTEDRLRQKKASLVKCINTAIARTERKTGIYETDISGSEDFDDYRIKGELITANLYKIGRGDKEVCLENYYSENGGNIIIGLDENLSPAANAQLYFKRYRKKRSTHENAEKNLGEALSELAYLKSVETLLENCTESADISEIREELTSEGYIISNSVKKARRSDAKARKNTPRQTGSKHSVITVSDGYEVWIGKNNTQNDLITTRLSAPDDIWFHVKNAPGSHVILRTSLRGGEFTKASVEDAAKLAALNSSQKSSSKVEVDFTRIKYVKKPAGARPGKVVFTNQRTIVAELLR